MLPFRTRYSPLLLFSDSLGNFIPGLADTSGWLGPAGQAPKGIISNIWGPLNEYFLYDPSPAAECRSVRSTPGTSIFGN